MPWGYVVAAGIGAYGVSQAAETTAEATETASQDQLQAAAEAQALNIERYGEAQELLDPYIGEARTAREQYMIEMGLAPGEAGTAYMETPGYQALLEERQLAAQQAASQSGSLYSGSRIKAASDIGGATQNQFYQNYMGMLQNLGSPDVATNLASLGVGQAATIGGQNIAAQQTASQAQLAGAASQQALTGDIIGGAAQIYGGYLASRPPQAPYTVPGDAYQPAQQTGYI